jgi:hypothetical protein
MNQSVSCQVSKQNIDVCIVIGDDSGTPPLKVVWVHNDSPLVDCPEFQHLDYGNGRYALRLSDPFTHDSGVYFCEAYNRHGDAESWCRLIVTDPTDKPFK